MSSFVNVNELEKIKGAFLLQKEFPRIEFTSSNIEIRPTFGAS